jgi:hypothetical protein
MRLVQAEMQDLVDRFGTVCSLVVRDGSDFVIKERACSASYKGYATPRGLRLPLLPQLAAPFFVESPDAEVRSWLDSLKDSQAMTVG